MAVLKKIIFEFEKIKLNHITTNYLLYIMNRSRTCYEINDMSKYSEELQRRICYLSIWWERPPMEDTELKMAPLQKVLKTYTHRKHSNEVRNISGQRGECWLLQSSNKIGWQRSNCKGWRNLGRHKLEAKMCSRKINGTETCRVSRIKQGQEWGHHCNSPGQWRWGLSQQLEEWNDF